MCNAAPSMEAQRSAWQRWGWLLRWLGTAAGIGYIATLIDVDDVRAAFARIPIVALLAAIGLVGANVVIGAARWRAVLAAYEDGRLSAPRYEAYLRILDSLRSGI